MENDAFEAFQRAYLRDGVPIRAREFTDRGQALHASGLEQEPRAGE